MLCCVLARGLPNPPDWNPLAAASQLASITQEISPHFNVTCS
jgi:hypothetical protein